MRALPGMVGAAAARAATARPRPVLSFHTPPSSQMVLRLRFLSRPSLEAPVKNKRAPMAGICVGLRRATVQAVAPPDTHAVPPAARSRTALPKRGKAPLLKSFPAKLT